jgi:hypothetical protein
MRSMTQLHNAVSAMPSTSTMSSARPIEEIPRICVRIRNRMRAMKAETMNTSPWAKFTMPMMPNTIV